MWNPTGGNYTRYGPVAELLADPDDRMVIMGSGDELGLLFDAVGLPELPVGWKRDFLLLVDGWAKDADANTAFSQTVLPLPFHAMSRYPYPAGEKFPDDPEHSNYLREYNTRPALRLIRGLDVARALVPAASRLVSTRLAYSRDPAHGDAFDAAAPGHGASNAPSRKLPE
jgi:hypothetical protein